MYLKHYNLTSKPFAISPDPKFLWLGKKYREALAALKYGILDNKGFISLTGDVGTGKTTLINALANSLGDNTIFALVAEPSLEQLDFLNLTADAFKMDKKFSTKGDFLSHLKHFLNDAYDHHKEVVLVIEEAQRFDQDRLEEVRLISNIEKPNKKLITIIFVGQNEFNSILIKNKSLRQRIAINHKIEPLTEFETEQYILHRLKIAGSERKIFSPEAVREIYSFSEGNPRLINIICDLALLTGYAKDIKIIEPEIIRECAANCLTPKQQKEDAIVDLRASSKSIPETGTGIQPGTPGDSYPIVAKKVREEPAKLKLAYIPPLFVVILLSIFGYLYFVGENHRPYRDFKAFFGQTFKPYTGSKLETSSLKPDEIEKLKEEIAVLRDQLLALKLQNASSDTQPGQMITRNAEFAAALNELKGAKERVALLEGMTARREQTLSQSEQKVTDLTDGLDREKKSQELLRAELSTKANLVAELQQKMEITLSSQSKLENEIEISKNENAALQSQLSDLKAQKTTSDTQLEQLRSRNETLKFDLAELKGAKERVAALEEVAARREQTLTASTQQVTDLTSALDREKKGQEKLSAELSTKADLVSELQQKLEATLSSRSELENDIEKSKTDIAALQEQLLDAKAQKGTSDDQEKKSRERLSSELSAKANLIAELQEKLGSAQSKALTFEAEIENSKIKINELENQLSESLAQRAPTESSMVKEIAMLRGQLSDLKAQKASADTQLDQLRSRNESLAADLAELKGAKERVAELEQVAARRKQTLSESEQKVTDLTDCA